MKGVECPRGGQGLQATWSPRTILVWKQHMLTTASSYDSGMGVCVLTRLLLTAVARFCVGQGWKTSSRALSWRIPHISKCLHLSVNLGWYSDKVSTCVGLCPSLSNCLNRFPERVVPLCAVHCCNSKLPSHHLPGRCPSDALAPLVVPLRLVSSSSIAPVFASHALLVHSFFAGVVRVLTPCTSRIRVPAARFLRVLAEFAWKLPRRPHLVNFSFAMSLPYSRPFHGWCPFPSVEVGPPLVAEFLGKVLPGLRLVPFSWCFSGPLCCGICARPLLPRHLGLLIPKTARCPTKVTAREGQLQGKTLSETLEGLCKPNVAAGGLKPPTRAPG